MKTIIAIALFVVSLAATAQSSNVSVYPSYCDEYSLISNQHTTIYKFSYKSDCKRALLESRVNNGRFCDEKRLVRPGGDVAYIFNSTSDCTLSLHGLRESNRDLFCYEGNLLHINRGFVINLDYHSDCRIALQQMSRYHGFFCKEKVMMNERGEVVRKFDFGSDCILALYSIRG